MSFGCCPNGWLSRCLPSWETLRGLFRRRRPERTELSTPLIETIWAQTGWEETDSGERDWGKGIWDGQVWEEPDWDASADPDLGAVRHLMEPMPTAGSFEPISESSPPPSSQASHQWAADTQTNESPRDFLTQYTQASVIHQRPALTNSAESGSSLYASCLEQEAAQRDQARL